MGAFGKAEECGKQHGSVERIYASTGDDTKVVRVTSSTAPLPSFFVIGPPRTGTTWLHETLNERTNLPFPTKETRFFDKHFHRGLDWYRAHYPRILAGRRTGEIAPTYFASKEATERMARTVPNAKVVCIFRNPVHRVLSLYKLKCAYGLIPWTFEQALVRDPEMLESSKYATRLRDWQVALGTQQILVTFYEDLCERPQSYLDQLVDFISVPRFALPETSTMKVHASEAMTYPRSYHSTRSASTMADWFKARRLDGFVAAVRNSPLRKLFLGGGAAFKEVPKETVLRLYGLFRAEVEDLEAILNRDLSSWKTGAERLGMDVPLQISPDCES